MSEPYAATMNSFTNGDLVQFLCEEIAKRHEWWEEARQDINSSRRDANTQQRLGLQLALGKALVVRSGRSIGDDASSLLVSIGGEYYGWWKDARS